MGKGKFIIGDKIFHEGKPKEPLDLSESVMSTRISNLRKGDGQIIFDTFFGEFTLNYDGDGEEAFEALSIIEKSGKPVKIKYK